MTIFKIGSPRVNFGYPKESEITTIFTMSSGKYSGFMKQDL